MLAESFALVFAQGEVPGAVGKWWFEAEFPDYEATLGDDPRITLKEVT